MGSAPAVCRRHFHTLSAYGSCRSWRATDKYRNTQGKSTVRSLFGCFSQTGVVEGWGGELRVGHGELRCANSLHKGRLADDVCGVRQRIVGAHQREIALQRRGRHNVGSTQDLWRSAEQSGHILPAASSIVSVLRLGRVY